MGLLRRLFNRNKEKKRHEQDELKKERIRLEQERIRLEKERAIIEKEKKILEDKRVLEETLKRQEEIKLEEQRKAEEYEYWRLWALNKQKLLIEEQTKLDEQRKAEEEYEYYHWKEWAIVNKQKHLIETEESRFHNQVKNSEEKKVEENINTESLREVYSDGLILNEKQLKCQMNLNIEDYYFMEEYGVISTVFDAEYEQDEKSDSYYQKMFEIYYNNDEDEIYREHREYEDYLDAEYELEQLIKEYQKDLLVIESEYEQEEEQDDEVIDIDFSYYYRYYFDEDDYTCDIDLKLFLRDTFENNDEYDYLFDTSEVFMFPLHMYLHMCRIYNLDSSSFMVELAEGVSFLGEKAECVKISEISLLKMDDQFFERFVDYVCITEQRYDDIMSEVLAEEFEREMRD